MEVSTSPFGGELSIHREHATKLPTVGEMNRDNLVSHPAFRLRQQAQTESFASYYNGHDLRWLPRWFCASATPLQHHARAPTQQASTACQHDGKVGRLI
jgi:hypothetical protein